MNSGCVVAQTRSLARRRSWGATPAQRRGFTLIEVMVALGIVAIALAAGARATESLTRNSERQSEVLLAGLCGDNELIKTRLARLMPPIGESSAVCLQAGVEFRIGVSTTPTLNPNFRRVDVQVNNAGEAPVLRLSTVVGRF
ncbi:MAG: type II secretion system minor pseudopilin GspI [Variovorax sp.]